MTFQRIGQNVYIIKIIIFYTHYKIRNQNKENQANAKD